MSAHTIFPAGDEEEENVMVSSDVGKEEDTKEWVA